MKNHKGAHLTVGQCVSITIGGPLFVQILHLIGNYHEVSEVERVRPEAPISNTDYHFFVKLKNGKKFELRYGNAPSGTFSGYYFRHSKFNKGDYTKINSVEKQLAIKNFLKLNFTQTKINSKEILRKNSRPTKVYKTHSCWKCGGKGYLKQYHYVAMGVCFACNRDGHIPMPQDIQEDYYAKYRKDLENS